MTRPAPKRVHVAIANPAIAAKFADRYNAITTEPIETIFKEFGWAPRNGYMILASARKHYPGLFIGSRKREKITAKKVAMLLKESSVTDAIYHLPLSRLDPGSEAEMDDLVSRMADRFDRTKAKHEYMACVDVSITLDGPVGILWHGDPHIDDDGTDIRTLYRHAELCRETEGLYAANLGDTTNNWIGRLARLYGSQETSEATAAALANHWLHKYDMRDAEGALTGKTKWLLMISGNHDVWHGDSRDMVAWIARQVGTLHQSSEARIALNFPNGERVTINARHDFTGHSMWNPAHGVGRAVQQGNWDDINICGHRHVSGYMILKSPNDGKICHAIQVASYKLYDRYAREKGFRDQSVSPAVVTVIDPYADAPTGRVTVFHDVEAGVEYLKFARARFRQREAA